MPGSSLASDASVTIHQLRAMNFVVFIPNVCDYATTKAN